MGLDFEPQKLRLQTLIQETRDRKDKTFYCILLTQLTGGARIGEAVDAMLKYADNGNKEQRVRVEKRKDKHKRLIIIPPLVRKYPQVKQELLAMHKRYSNLANTVENFAIRRLNFNTHAQRYSFVTKASSEMHVQAIAALTGHKTLDHILHYTTAKPAEAKYRDWVK